MNSLDLSPEQFQILSEQIVAIATDFLKSLDSRVISPQVSGEEANRRFKIPLPEVGLHEQAIQQLGEVVHNSRAQNGRFFGYVLGSGEPVAAAADLLCSVLNQNVTAWRSSPAGAAIEQTVVGWLAQSLLCAEFRGVFCGGGSAANLMGLAMAREAKAPANKSGIQSAPRLAVYASSQVHMSIPKALALLGIGRDNLRLIPVDDAFRMIPAELERQIQSDTAQGIIPTAVVSTAGTVSTGAIDPLPEIADVARKFHAWLHVDGSYGALAAIAKPESFPGLNTADSISLDPHKWLYQPIDCGCLLYKDSAAARSAFSYSGEYVRALSTDPIESFTFFDETVELSRRFRALKLWLSFRYHGFAAFRQSIVKDLAHAQRLAATIEKSPALELLAPVSLSAVCFRYVGDGINSPEELNRLNSEILRRVLQRGKIYLSNAALRSAFSLRACIVNHRTTDDDIDAICREVLASAREIGGKTGL